MKARGALAVAIVVALGATGGCSGGESKAEVATTTAATVNPAAKFCSALVDFDNANAALAQVGDVVDQTKDDDPSGAIKILDDALAEVSSAAKAVAAVAPKEVATEAKAVAEAASATAADPPGAEELLDATKAEATLDAFRKAHC